MQYVTRSLVLAAYLVATIMQARVVLRNRTIMSRTGTLNMIAFVTVTLWTVEYVWLLVVNPTPTTLGIAVFNALGILTASTVIVLAATARRWTPVIDAEQEAMDSLKRLAGE